MTDNAQQRRKPRDRSVSREVLASPREVSLAKLLLHVANELGARDNDQEFLELYNAVKPIAEGALRHAK